MPFAPCLFSPEMVTGPPRARGSRATALCGSEHAPHGVVRQNAPCVKEPKLAGPDASPTQTRQPVPVFQFIPEAIRLVMIMDVRFPLGLRDVENCRSSVASTSAMRLFTIAGTASGRCSRVTFVDSGCAKSALGRLRQNLNCLALGAKLPLPPILNESLLSDGAGSTA